jgi:hypothetical protein
MKSRFSIKRHRDKKIWLDWQVVNANIALCHGWGVELEAEPRMLSMKYWEIIADNLTKAGWSLGWVSALDCQGRTIWIADTHRSDGKRFAVRADEKLTAFVELKSAIRAAS